MAIKHYIGVWLPGVRDDATVKAGTGAINFSDYQVSDSGDVVQQVLQGLEPGSYEVDCLAEEGAQSVRANTLPVAIYLLPKPPTINDRTSYKGVPVDIDGTAGWENTNGGTWGLTNPPTGLSIDGGTGRIKGTPSENGFYTPVAITYNDGAFYSTNSVTWSIVDLPPAPEGTGGGMGLDLNLKI